MNNIPTATVHYTPGSVFFAKPVTGSAFGSSTPSLLKKLFRGEKQYSSLQELFYYEKDFKDYGVVELNVKQKKRFKKLEDLVNNYYA